MEQPPSLSALNFSPKEPTIESPKNKPKIDSVIPIIKASASPIQAKSCKFASYKYLAFFLTGLLYAFFHALRTVWAYIKPSLKDKDPFYTSSKLGFLDLAFTTAYAIGLYISGWLGDRMNLKKFLTMGTLTAAISLAAFGVLEGYIEIEKMGIDVIAFIFNGLGQSTGYPGCITIISNWFGHHKTGLVFGIWGMNLNIGNIIGQQIGRVVLNKNWHWATALIFASLAVVLCLIILVFCIKVHPKDLNPATADPAAENINQPNEQDIENDVTNLSISTPTTPAQGINFMQAWKIKYVPQYALAFFCIKGVIYGILLWLPTYLVDNLKMEGDIASLLASVEIGQIFGSIILGLVSDKIKSRPIAITFGFFYAVLFLAFISVTPAHANQDLFWSFFFMAGVGLGGPASLISGAVSSDLGQKLMETRNINAISTITGIMEGCGAAGAAATQLLIANYTSITFPFFAGLCAIGGTLIAPMAMEDIKIRRELKNTLAVEQQQQSPAECSDNTKEIEIAKIKSVEDPVEVENNSA